MYKDWKRVVKNGYESAFPPQFVAKAVMKALRAKQPMTRYLSDPIAKGMVATAKKSTDRALDKFLRHAMG
jgi:hypothetical protein